MNDLYHVVIFSYLNSNSNNNYFFIFNVARPLKKTLQSDV
jgi:hypothetical protein